MDMFELNKIAGATLAALLVFFGARTVGDQIFASHAPEKPGYEIAVAEPESDAKPDAEAPPELSLAQLLAEADADKGQSVAKKCVACHSFEQGGVNKVGPNLHGIVGQDIGSVDGFAYSDAMASKEGGWSYESLDAYLANPKGYLPGTKMAFAGIKKADQRADLILYLRSLGGTPPPLPEAEAAEAQPASAEEPQAPTQ